MNSVERAQRDMLFALVMEAARGRDWEDDLDALKAKYHLNISDSLLSASLEPWEDEGLLSVSRHSDGCAAFVKPSRYGTALGRLMNLLGAKQLEFNWAKEEIFTDVNPIEEWPSPNGWKLYVFESGSVVNGEPVYGAVQHVLPEPERSGWWRRPVNWTKWGTILTGLGIVVAVVLWQYS